MTRKEDRKRNVSKVDQLPEYVQKIEDRNDKPMDAHTRQDGKVDTRKMSGDHISETKDGKGFRNGH
jgi:hypothetical protein